MYLVGQKRPSVASGDTPNKPAQKRKPRASLFTTARKPLQFITPPKSPVRKVRKITVNERVIV
jgi:hypothetical protein